MGCARVAAPGHAPAAPPVQVEVTNHNRRDVTVYAHWSGVRVRLGTAPAGQTRRFALRYARADGSARLVLSAEVIGSTEAVLTPQVALYPDALVRFDVQDLLSTSASR